MIMAILLMAISQCFPFDKGSYFMRDRRNSDFDAVHGVDHSAYSAHPYLEVDGSGPNSGFESHPYAIPILLILGVLFFSSLYLKPNWNAKVYWVALLLSIACAEFPPPVDTLGGALAAISMVMIAYAAYTNMKDQAKTT